MVFSAVSMVSSFQADDDTHDLIGVGERNKTKTECVVMVVCVYGVDLDYFRDLRDTFSIALFSDSEWSPGVALPFRDLRQPTRNITYFASVIRKMRSLQHTPWN